MSGDLPKGWAKVRLEDLAFHPKQDIVDGPFGSNLKASEYVSEGVPIIRLQNIDRNHFLNKNLKFITEDKASELSRHSFRTGDIIITKLGNPVGKACVVPPNLEYGIIVADVVRARVCERAASGKFVTYAINTSAVASQLNHEVKGTTRPRVNLSHIRSLEIPLAPSNEQRRIVAKLEELLGKVGACQKRLERIPLILKRFRQSVLAAACFGRLTEDWRIENMIEQRESIDSGEDEIPYSWRKVCIGDVISDLRYGTAQRCAYDKKGVPVLRIPNIGNGIIDHSDLKYATLSGKEIESLRLQKGDILLIRSNGSVSLVGKSAIVQKKEIGFAYAGYLIRIRPIGAVIDPLFLNLVLGSYDIRLQIELEARSTSGVNNINGEEVRALRFSLPTLSEQKEIVHRINGLFSFADQIEARYQKAKAPVDRLTQSILAKAFRGELVPQDPNDEPAEVLLERIRKERWQVATQARACQ